MIVTPAAGWILDLNFAAEDKYSVLFSIYCAIKLSSALVTLQLDLTFKKKSSLVLRHLVASLGKKSILRFLLVYTVLGAVWGLLETHLYLYLDHLAISKQNIGLSQSLATLTGNQ